MYKVNKDNLLAERIKLARQALPMSQSELARALGIKPQAVQHWENGTSCPKTERLADLSTVLGVKVSWLIDSDSSAEMVYESSPIVYGELSADEQFVLKMFRQMKAKTRITFTEIAEVMANQKR